MATAEKTVTRSEDILGEKWDKCVVDAGIKLSTGIVVGKNNAKFLSYTYENVKIRNC